MSYKPRFGLIGIGLQAYWAQFHGLEERLQGYVAEVEMRMGRDTRTIVNFGLVDTPQKAIEIGHSCRREDLDVLFVYITTYALSAIVLPVVLRAKVPVVLLNLQPEPSLDYGRLRVLETPTEKTGEWLAYCNACPAPEIANVLRRLDLPFHQVTGALHGDDSTWSEIDDWLLAAEVVHALSHARLGLMGHYYSGMLDIATDLAQVSGRFGVHVEMLEVDELTRLRLAATPEQRTAKVAEFRESFQVENDCTAEELDRTASTAVALDFFAEQNSLDMLAYYYKGSGVVANEDTMSSIILGTSLLTGRHIPVAGEYEVKNVLAMKILDLLGAGGSFTEYYALDFAEDLVLMGHDGPGHLRMAQERMRVRPLRVYHGKVGRGLSVEMQVKHGPVTLLSVVEDRGRGFALLVAEGESVAGPVLEIGNTNSRYHFPLGARRFTESWNAHGPAHHCAVGLGHQAQRLRKVAALMNLPFVQVC